MVMIIDIFHSNYEKIGVVPEYNVPSGTSRVLTSLRCLPEGGVIVFSFQFLYPYLRSLNVMKCGMRFNFNFYRVLVLAGTIFEW